MLTFGGEVGLALCLVGPVHHQVPKAAETVGDLICSHTHTHASAAGEKPDVSVNLAASRPAG